MICEKARFDFQMFIESRVCKTPLPPHPPSPSITTTTGDQKEGGRRAPRSMSESSEVVPSSRKNNKKKKRTSSETKERADSLSENTGLFLGDQDFVPLKQWYVNFLIWVSRGVLIYLFEHEEVTRAVFQTWLSGLLPRLIAIHGRFHGKVNLSRKTNLINKFPIEYFVTEIRYILRERSQFTNYFSGYI